MGTRDKKKDDSPVQMEDGKIIIDTNRTGPLSGRGQREICELVIYGAYSADRRNNPDHSDYDSRVAGGLAYEDCISETYESTRQKAPRVGDQGFNRKRKGYGHGE